MGPEQPLPGVGDHATVLTQVIFLLLLHSYINSFSEVYDLEIIEHSVLVGDLSRRSPLSTE